jgi:catechol 2,3-dioxygenase-like lactoylglutathione lyase family enzyme
MLGNQKLVAFVPASNADEARAFYRDKLGLRMLSEDTFALVFDTKGIHLRVTLVGKFNPQPFTVLGWAVNDAAAAARTLAGAGVFGERFPGLEQDDLGIWTAPGGAKILWFKDPDGNILSLSQLP